MRLLLFLLLFSACTADKDIVYTKCDLDTNYCKWKIKYYKKKGRDCCWIVGSVKQQNAWKPKVYEYCPCHMGVKYTVVDTASIFCR